VTRLPQLDTGERYLHRARIIGSSIMSVQACAEGPLAVLRAIATSLLIQETGMNVGYGMPDWNLHTLEEWLAEPTQDWVFADGLAWEVTIGLSMWLAVMVGDPARARESQTAFLRSASDSAMRGDFFELRNDGRLMPTIDALVAFFRDGLLNRLLENVPKLRDRFRASIDPEVADKIREWTLPHQRFWPAAVRANAMDARNVTRELVRLRDETSCTTPV
jgi:hypothetical protein